MARQKRQEVHTALRRPKAWPFYIICDVSRSMWDPRFHDGNQHTPWHVMRDGLADLVFAVEESPTASDICHLGVIAFADTVTEVLPLTSFRGSAMSIGALPQGSYTDYAQLFHDLAGILDRDLSRLATTHDSKPPAIFFITDGEATGPDGELQPDDVWKAQLSRVHGRVPQPDIVTLGLGEARESALVTIRAGRGPACLADLSANPGDLLKSIIDSIVKSVLASTTQESFWFDVPASMKRLA